MLGVLSGRYSPRRVLSGIATGAALGLLLAVAREYFADPPIDQHSYQLGHAEFESWLQVTGQLEAGTLHDIRIYPAESGYRLLTAVLERSNLPPLLVYFAAPEPYVSATGGGTLSPPSVTTYIDSVRSQRPDAPLAYTTLGPVHSLAVALAWAGVLGLAGGILWSLAKPPIPPASHTLRGMHGAGSKQRRLA